MTNTQTTETTGRCVKCQTTVWSSTAKRPGPYGGEKTPEGWIHDHCAR